MSGRVGRRVRTGRRLRAVASVVGPALLPVACGGTSSAQLDARFVDSVLPRRFAGLALDTYCP